MVEDTAVYHCTVRMVDGLAKLDPESKQELVSLMRLVTEFAGVQLFTYCVMDDHFHVLVSIPSTIHLDDIELIRRYRLLYPAPHKYLAIELDQMERTLLGKKPGAARVRKKILNRMGDISSFMKDLKQRFCLWYNKRVGRTGTLWAERFKSLLVENASPAVEVVGAYIDLNPVRAGFCQQPEEYPFSGYGAACAGDRHARAGIVGLFGCANWAEAKKAYRKVFSGSQPGEPALTAFSRREALRIIAEGGEVPLAWALRCRVRYFSDGAVMGTPAFVQQWYVDHRGNFPRRKDGPRKMVGSHWAGLAVFRDLKKDVFA